MSGARSSGTYSKVPSILKLHGIEWAYSDHEGRLALGYYKFAIVYNPADKLYHLKESGKSLFSDPDMSKCLDAAPEFIFDYFADQLTG